MNETLTGDQFREQAEKALDGRKIDKETLRTWIDRGADRINALAENRLENGMSNETGSEAALMVLENAREASEKTLERVREMEAAASSALGEARDRAQVEADSMIADARAAAAELVADGERTAEAHVAETDRACEVRLNAATAQAEQISRAGRELQDRVEALESTYRDRLVTIRGEAESLFSALDRLDHLAITDESDDLKSEEVLVDFVDEADLVDEPDFVDEADLVDEIVDLDPDTALAPAD